MSDSTQPQEGARPDRPRRRRRLVRVATRERVDPSRTSPRMRFDLLQIVAWILGLAMVVMALVAVARAGFEDLALFDPVVEVAGLPATPLLAALGFLTGLLLLAAATGEVDERGLRILGIVLGVVGVVWMIEPDAFAEYLGVAARSGVALLVAGAALTGVSFVPPLSIARPGASTHEGPRFR